MRARLPADVGWVAVGAYNGEGYTNRELNRGKNLEAAVALHLPRGPLRPLTLFGSYVLGSSGTGLSRADRLTGALLWQGDRVRAGVSVTRGWGVDDDGARGALLVEGFARVEPVARLLVGLRATCVQATGGTVTFTQLSTAPDAIAGSVTLTLPDGSTRTARFSGLVRCRVAIGCG